MPISPEVLRVLDWRTLTDTANLLLPVPRFLNDMLIGTNVRDHATQQIDVDVVVGSRRMAPVVRRGSPYKVVNPDTFRQDSLIPPRIAPMVELRAEELYTTRAAGYQPYNPTGREITNAALQHIADAQRMLADMIDRTKEFMLAQLLFGKDSDNPVDHTATAGRFSLTDSDGYTVNVDINQPPGNRFALTGLERWIGGDTPNPNAPIYAQLRNWMNLARTATGYTPTMLIGSELAIAALFANTELRAMHDVRRFDTGVFSPKVVPDSATGATYHGRLLNLDIYSYSHQVIPFGETASVNLVNRYKVALVSPLADFRLHRAAIPDVNAGLVLGRFSKSWTEENPSAMYMSMEERPMPVPHHPGIIVSVQVGTTAPLS